MTKPAKLQSVRSWEDEVNLLTTTGALISETILLDRRCGNNRVRRRGSGLGVLREEIMQHTEAAWCNIEPCADLPVCFEVVSACAGDVPDPDFLSWSLKYLIDGTVAAGVLPEDTAHEISRIVLHSPRQLVSKGIGAPLPSEADKVRVILVLTGDGLYQRRYTRPPHTMSQPDATLRQK